MVIINNSDSLISAEDVPSISAITKKTVSPDRKIFPHDFGILLCLKRLFNPNKKSMLMNVDDIALMDPVPKIPAIIQMPKNKRIDFDQFVAKSTNKLTVRYVARAFEFR